MQNDTAISYTGPENQASEADETIPADGGWTMDERAMGQGCSAAHPYAGFCQGVDDHAILNIHPVPYNDR